jgi:3-hydroxybutyrate dehydrogenase
MVTGGAGGIGRACAYRLARDGARVVVVDLDVARAEAVAAEIGGEHLGVDLSDPDFDPSAAAGVDVLVNCAGVQHIAPVEEFPPEQFRRLLQLMLQAPFRLIQAALPGMYGKQFGRIVNMSSVHGLRASPYKSAYVSAKHGLEGLSKTVALEAGPRGVTCNTVCPAYVRTPLVENQIADQARTHHISEEAVLDQVMLTQPAVKRLIEPSEVADAVAYLCGPSAGYVNGVSLVIDGGWTAR